MSLFREVSHVCHHLHIQSCTVHSLSQQSYVHLCKAVSVSDGPMPHKFSVLLPLMLQLILKRNSPQASSVMLSLKRYQKHSIPKLNSDHLLSDTGLKKLRIHMFPASSSGCWELQTILIYVISLCR